MTLPKLIVSAALALSASLASTQASAQVVETFASFSLSDRGSNVAWTNDGTGGSFTSTGGTTITPGTRNVSFSFLRPDLASLADITAVFSMTASAASGSPAIATGDFLTQGGITGSFSFTTTQAFEFDGTVFAAGSNLLSGMFGNAAIFGRAGGDIASFNGSNDPGQSLFYLSDFFDGGLLTDEQFGTRIDLVGGPLSAAPGSALDDFSGTMFGSFSAAFGAPVPAVPEPGTWAMMILGFGFVGSTMRVRRRKLAFATA